MKTKLTILITLLVLTLLPALAQTADQDIATVETWLQSHGFSVSKVNPGKLTIEFSGNVAQMRSAFHTQIHKYAVNGEEHYANATNPEVPAALAPVIGGFASLNNFRLLDVWLTA